MGRFPCTWCFAGAPLIIIIVVQPGYFDVYRLWYLKIDFELGRTCIWNQLLSVQIRWKRTFNTFIQRNLSIFTKQGCYTLSKIQTKGNERLQKRRYFGWNRSTLRQVTLYKSSLSHDNLKAGRRSREPSRNNKRLKNGTSTEVARVDWECQLGLSVRGQHFNYIWKNK